MKNIKLFAMIGLIGLVGQMSASSNQASGQYFGPLTVEQNEQTSQKLFGPFGSRVKHGQSAKKIQTGWRHHKQAQALRKHADMIRAEAELKDPETPQEALHQVLIQGGSVGATNAVNHLRFKEKAKRFGDVISSNNLSQDEKTYAAMLEGALDEANLDSQQKLEVLQQMIEQVKQHSETNHQHG